MRQGEKLGLGATVPVERGTLEREREERENAKEI